MLSVQEKWWDVLYASNIDVQWKFDAVTAKKSRVNIFRTDITRTTQNIIVWCHMNLKILKFVTLFTSCADTFPLLYTLSEFILIATIVELAEWCFWSLDSKRWHSKTLMHFKYFYYWSLTLYIGLIAAATARECSNLIRKYWR